MQKVLQQFFRKSSKGVFTKKFTFNLMIENKYLKAAICQTARMSIYVLFFLSKNPTQFQKLLLTKLQNLFVCVLMSLIVELHRVINIYYVSEPLQLVNDVTVMTFG